jgi:hypothetical protein
MLAAAGLLPTLAFAGLVGTPAEQSAAAGQSFSAVFWSAENMGGGPALTRLQYEEQALVFALQGLVNRGAPRLFIDVGADDFDNAHSEQAWRQVLEPHVAWNATVAPQLCALVEHFAGVATGVIAYPSDGFSVFVALTLSGLGAGHLPASAPMLERYPCLRSLPVAEDLGLYGWHDTYAAHRWSIDNLLPRCNRTLVWDANWGPASRKMSGLQANATLMSVDYAVMQRAFIFNLNPCNASLNDNNGNAKLCAGIPPQDTALFAEIVQKSGPLISIYGWSEPENGFTDTASKNGGVSFCTFSTPNLSFWRILSVAANATPLPLPHHDSGEKLDAQTHYVTFVTNEGDTPRILTSQFARAWQSPKRGSVPVVQNAHLPLRPFLPRNDHLLCQHRLGTNTTNQSKKEGAFLCRRGGSTRCSVSSSLRCGTR